MQKIISLFQRNYYTDYLVRDEVVPGAEWVLAGEGIATRKWDGTCCMIKEGKLFKRYDVKKGKPTPVGFIAAQERDLITGHWPGWLPIGDGPEDAVHKEALVNIWHTPSDGTYELCGPSVNGNPDFFPIDVLVKHGDLIVDDVPRTFVLLKEWLEIRLIEGIVWHHPDGRMVKIKRKDFFRK